MAGSSGAEDHKITRNNMVSSTGYCYSDVSSSHHPHMVSQYDSNPDVYNLTTGIELIGFPHKNLLSTIPNNAMWKGFTSANPISDIPHDSTSWHENNRVLVDDPSMRCVFPCEPNERPSQGLSLSLSSTNPSTIGLQSFELRHQQDDTRCFGSSSRDGFFGKTTDVVHQQQQQNQMIQDHRFLGKGVSTGVDHQNQDGFMMRNSKYLGPAQELLNEFCNLGIIQNDHLHQKTIKHQKINQWEDESASSSSKQPSNLHSLELLELQKRKAKLLQMLEEVDRRYQHYCDQMKAVVSSFEAVAGSGAATVYSALASKAMSRHFRCLRDGIVGQIKSTKKAMGDKDTSVPGSTRGETPRLRLLDQTLRQQRAFQQMSMMESHPWRPQRGLPERSVSVLRAWLFEHFLHPYPSDVDKHILARQTGLSRSQVSNWFINARVRLWKPMVEEMYIEETKDQQDNMSFSDGIEALNDNNLAHQNPNHHQSRAATEDQKPTQDQLVRIDSECLSSIINHPDKNTKIPKNPQNNINHHHDFHHQNFGSFGAVELDFSSYNHHSAGGGVVENYGGSGGGGGGVSLTLGLQQHGVGGVNLAFSPTSQSSLFYGGRDHIEDCQPVQYSLLDGEGQNLPYRNLMGAQLLHDLA
ncbi:hypothetical protein LguiA_015691 [Lonicera macranthoides]